VAYFEKKREIDGFTLWMERASIYTSVVVGSKTTHMGYVKQKICSK